MILLDILEKCQDSTVVEVYDSYKVFLGRHDGKDSIDSRLDNFDVDRIDCVDGKLIINIFTDAMEPFHIGKMVCDGRWKVVDVDADYVWCVDPNGDPDDEDSYMTFTPEELLDDIFTKEVL